MQRIEQNIETMPSEYWRSAGIQTTLYEIVEAVNEEVCPGEENWAPLIVSHILGSGRSVPSEK